MQVPQSLACPFFVMSKNKIYQPIEGESLVDIIGFEGKYIATSMGRILALPNLKSRNNKNKTLVLSQNVWGEYYKVTLTDYEGKRFPKLVNRLVCTAFHENPEQKAEVNHLDGNKLNNWSNNLEWNTHPENVMHALNTGLSKNIAETAGRAKITNEVALSIFTDNRRSRELSEIYNIAPTTIAAIKTGANWESITGKKYKARHTKKTPNEILDIYNSTESYKEIAVRHGITKDHVGRIKRGLFHAEITNYVKK